MSQDNTFYLYTQLLLKLDYHIALMSKLQPKIRFQHLCSCYFL